MALVIIFFSDSKHLAAMAREQTGICAEPNLHGVFLLFNSIEGREAALKTQLSRLNPLMDVLADQFSEANLNTVLGIGPVLWPKIELHVTPDFLNWSEFSSTEIKLPKRDYDILLHLRSDRFDVLAIAITQVMQLLAHSAELSEQWFSFRYLDGRELTGFYETPDNPKGRAKRSTALVQDAEKSLQGGSYLLLLKHRFEFQAWSFLTLQEQEDIIGRTKSTGELLPLVQRQSNSHAERARLETESGRLDLLWQTMPFMDAKLQGLLALGCAAQPSDLLHYVHQRLGDVSGYDLLLDYSPIEQGALFFAPSLNLMERWR